MKSGIFQWRQNDCNYLLKLIPIIRVFDLNLDEFFGGNEFIIIFFLIHASDKFSIYKILDCC